MPVARIASMDTEVPLQFLKPLMLCMATAILSDLAIPV